MLNGHVERFIILQGAMNVRIIHGNVGSMVAQWHSRYYFKQVCDYLLQTYIKCKFRSLDLPTAPRSGKCLVLTLLPREAASYDNADTSKYDG